MQAARDPPLSVLPSALANTSPVPTTATSMPNPSSVGDPAAVVTLTTNSLSTPQVITPLRVSPLHVAAPAIAMTAPLSVGEITIPHTNSSPFKPPHASHIPAPAPSTPTPPPIVPSVPVSLASVASSLNSPNSVSGRILHTPHPTFQGGNTPKSLRSLEEEVYSTFAEVTAQPKPNILIVGRKGAVLLQFFFYILRCGQDKHNEFSIWPTMH